MSEASQVEPQDRPRRRRRRSSRARGASRDRMRLLYFSLASLWGMIAGTVGVIGAMSALDQPIQAHPLLLGGLALAAVLTVAGGAVAANAYRQASRR